ncbi:MAG TPA: DNA-binding domain-containing protein [Saprospiraceae bacterium]|nr:DNA-binding domain-containing protein [Saprospiraceae bacterium]
MSELETIQRWLTSIIIRPGELNGKINAADKKYQVDHNQLIRSSFDVTIEERISIYAKGYILRLMECMRADYPVLRDHFGDELFETFVKAYLVRYPSESFSLYELGNDFPDFLEASRPDRDNRQIEFDLPVDLAKLERARVEVYRSKGLEMNKNNHKSQHPVFILFQAEKFRISECLRLLLLSYPLIDFMNATERGQKPSVPSPENSFVAVSRKNYMVTMHELEPWQWYFLSSLEDTLDQLVAFQHACIMTKSAEEEILAGLMLWLPVAIENGYLIIE